MYLIQSQSRYGKENLDHARTRDEAQSLVEEYSLAFGPGFRITYRQAGSNRRTGIDGKKV